MSWRELWFFIKWCSTILQPVLSKSPNHPSTPTGPYLQLHDAWRRSCQGTAGFLRHGSSRGPRNQEVSMSFQPREGHIYHIGHALLGPFCMICTHLAASSNSTQNSIQKKPPGALDPPLKDPLTSMISHDAASLGRTSADQKPLVADFATAQTSVTDDDLSLQTCQLGWLVLVKHHKYIYI
jgi:hypothetical protein